MCWFFANFLNGPLRPSEILGDACNDRCAILIAVANKNIGKTDCANYTGTIASSEVPWEDVVFSLNSLSQGCTLDFVAFSHVQQRVF